MDTYVSDLYDPAKEERRIAAEARALKNADDQRLQELLEREIKSFYTSNNTKKILRSAMYRSVFAMQLSVWDVLREHKCAENLVFMSNAAMEKAEATINNFQRMPKEDVLEIFPEILLLAPYNRELYKAMWSLFEDPDGELAVLAKYFGIDASFIRSKTELIVDKLFSEINPELKKSEQSALEAKEKFSLALKSNGVEDTQAALEYLDKINSVLRDFDLKARTFDGIVFNTREEAQKAQAEKEKAQAEKEENKRIDKYLSGLNYENSETDAKEAMIKL